MHEGAAPGLLWAALVIAVVLVVAGCAVGGELHVGPYGPAESDFDCK